MYYKHFQINKNEIWISIDKKKSSDDSPNEEQLKRQTNQNTLPKSTSKVPSQNFPTDLQTDSTV